MIDWRAMLIALATGVLSAAIVDVRAWADNNTGDWRFGIAALRWLWGGLAGLAAYLVAHQGESWLYGALSGLIGAIAVDLDNYVRNPQGGFSWRVAIPRWLMGLMTGLGAGLGGQVLPQ